ncbi:hypothetical protein TWF506_004863 [Arthrobotrys conoides]|uniref:Uncharacterized protein n=1 Tax=Arthrobotrys conoides TaxID=74498 RepID=A0AAN8NT02_9PEZI
MKILQYLFLFLCIFDGAYSTPLDNGKRPDSIQSTNLTTTSNKTNSLNSSFPGSPDLSPSHVSKPVAVETSASGGIMEKKEIVPSHLFYSQVNGMIAICPPRRHLMEIIMDYVKGRSSTPDLDPSQGLTLDEWEKQIERWDAAVVRNPDREKAKRYVRNLIRRCEGCLCDFLTAKMRPTPRGPGGATCNNAAIALKCHIYYKCVCYIDLIQPTIGPDYQDVPLIYFQNAINRIPEHIRRVMNNWLWHVPPTMAEYEGQTLGFTRDARTYHSEPLDDEPSDDELSDDETQVPHHDSDSNSDFDGGRLTPLYGPQGEAGGFALDWDSLFDTGKEDEDTDHTPLANPATVNFDWIDDYLVENTDPDLEGLDGFDISPGMEYDYGYGHGPHGYGYGFGGGSGSGGGAGGSGSGGGGGSGSAKRDLHRRNKDNQGDEGAKNGENLGLRHVPTTSLGNFRFG